MVSFTLKAEVVNVIMQTGFVGSAKEYVKKFYGKAFEELTMCEAEMIIRNLKDKEGCLFGTTEGGYGGGENKQTDGI